jgi:hypothetical protein
MVTVFLALCLMFIGRRSVPYRTKEDLGYAKDFPEGPTVNMLLGGYPDEGYGLAIACLAGLFLSGGHAPENHIVAAAFFLSSAWSFVNRVWPAPDNRH